MFSTSQLPTYQSTNIDFNKIPDLQNYYDKENCNVYQPKLSEKLSCQSKGLSTHPLSERIEELSSRSTQDSSPEYDQVSQLETIFQTLSNHNQKASQECLHLNIEQNRCTYCKDCGIFLPENNSKVFREEMYEEKITTNPDEVYEIMLKNQTKNRYYHESPPHIEQRKAITNWIFQVSQDLKLSPDTTAAAIAYVDTIFCQVEVSKENLRLVILSCLILATKYAEKDDKVPQLKEAYNLCCGVYSMDLFKKAQNLILEQLDWNLRVISPFQFAHHFLSRGCLFSTDQSVFSKVTPDILRYLRRYSECFINLSMDSYEFNQYLSHVVACAAIASTRKLIGVSPVWNSELEELTGTSWSVIEECFNKLYSSFEQSFPELVDLSKELADKTESQEEQIKNSVIQIEEIAMNIENAEMLDQNETLDTSMECMQREDQKEDLLKYKILKKRSLARLSKPTKEHKLKKK